MKHNVTFALLALPFALSVAHAQEDAASSVRISGFGTGALTWLDTDAAQFARPGQPSGAGKSPRPAVDSNLGLQADYTVNSWLSFTGQGLVRKDGEDDVGADLAWAFAKAKLSDTLSVRAGRIGLPVFMISDYRNVGYANTMLRPPQEVYAQIPTSFIDGGDVTWQPTVGDTTFTAQLALGRTKSGPAVVSGPRANGQMPVITLPTVKVSFTSAGMTLDWNDIVVQSEFAKPHSLAGSTDSWYAMAGYRFGKLLPYYNHGMTTGAAIDSVF